MAIRPDLTAEQIAEARAHLAAGLSRVRVCALLDVPYSALDRHLPPRAAWGADDPRRHGRMRTAYLPTGYTRAQQTTAHVATISPGGDAP